MDKSPTSPILGDHKRHKKKLLPPLIAAMNGGYSPYSWARELVPEFLWIALVVDHLGERNGVEACNKLGELAARVSKLEPTPLFATISSFSALSAEDKTTVAGELGGDTVQRLSLALRPLSDLAPQHELSFLNTDKQAGPAEGAAPIDVGQLLASLYDRHSRRTAITISVAFYMGLCQDKIRLPKHLAEKTRKDFDNIGNYPHTDESRAAAASFRASAPMFLIKGSLSDADPAHDAWLDLFWSKVAAHGECLSEPAIKDEGDEPEDPLSKFVHRFREAVKEELRSRLDGWGFDLNRIEVYEVIGALLARQATLAAEFSLSPACWTANSAPLFLRPMADVHVAVAWILGEPDERSKRFIEAGLGEIKLEIAHRLNHMGEIEDKDELQQQEQYVRHLETWLQSQRIGDLVEVNLGSWSGLSTREMAKEAGCLDFYNYVYQPFSSAIHSSWSHVSRLNTVYCENPSHRYHRLPAISEFDPDPNWIYLAGKYFNKTMRAFDRMAGLTAPDQTAFEVLRTELGRNNESE